MSELGGRALRMCHDVPARPVRQRSAMVASFVPALLPLLVLVLPVLVGVSYSLAASLGIVGAGATGFTVRHVVHTLRSANTWRSVAWTILTAGTATVIATGLAVVLAGPLSRRRIIRALALIPLAVPHGAAALAVLLLLGQSGMLARIAAALGWLHTPADMPALVYDSAGVGLTMAFVWKELPFLLLATLAARETLGDELEQTAIALGASPWAAWRCVTLPLLLRSVAPSAIAVLAFLLGQYEMAVVLAPSDPLPLPLLIAERTTDMNLAARSEAHVLALVAMVLAAALVWWHERLRAKQFTRTDS